jgi:hypothetical protein
MCVNRTIWVSACLVCNRAHKMGPWLLQLWKAAPMYASSRALTKDADLAGYVEIAQCITRLLVCSFKLTSSYPCNENQRDALFIFNLPS